MQNKNEITLRNVGHGVNDIYWFILPSLLPVILDHFNMKYGTAGGLLTAFLLVIAVFSFILGKISDYVARANILGLGFLIASTFLILSTFMHGFGSFMTFILLAGIGVSSFHPSAYALIDETTEYKQGRVYGTFEFWGSAAIFLMFFLHGFLLEKLSWKNIILVTSIPGLLVGTLYLTRSKELRYSRLREQKTISHAPNAPDIPPFLFILFLIVVALRFFGIIAVVNFTPTYLVREVGLDKSIASFATGIYFLGGLVFVSLMGRLCDRWGPFPVLLFSTAAAFPLIILVAVTKPLFLLPLYLLLLGGMYYGAGPAMNMIIAKMSSRLRKGEAFGYFMAIIAVTYSFSPLIYGVNADRLGLQRTMRFFSFPLLVSTVGLFILLKVVHANHNFRTTMAGHSKSR